MDWVVLFRGVNVGGHRKLPMAELRKGCADMGFENVQTYIQSGNLTLSTSQDAAEIKSRISKFVSTSFGFDVAMLVLNRKEFTQIVHACPYGSGDSDPSRSHIFFHMGTVPETDDLAACEGDAARMVKVKGAHYLDTPDGMSKSQLAEALSRRLKESATARNLRTCHKLLTMLG